jgi:hypothetical protein
MWRRTYIAVFSIICVLCISLSDAQAQGELDLDRIRRATVYIMQTQEIGGRPIITCVGSGTIVHRDGLIATNAHNTVANIDCPGDRLVIALSIRPDEPPIPTYYADVVQSNEGLDLALLRITHELSGRLVEPGTLSLPFVDLGDSSRVLLDDTITVVGYPNIGGDPVANYRGTIVGFVAEPSGGERSWIKTDATITGIMTGGGVYDQEGRLIGIPTTVPVTPFSAGNTCVPLEDTNNDNLINSNDRCIPIGGFINALRPSNFVLPLLRGASLGISVEKLQLPEFLFDTGNEPRFSRLFISPAATEGMPTNVVFSLPTGTTSLYLFFDYSNMTQNTIYELRVTIDNIPNSTFSLAPVRWSGGTNGLWYIGGSGQVWPNGIYEFTLFINGLVSDSYSIIIGVQEQDAPNFRNIIFGIEDGDNIYGTAYVLPVGNIANARFVHQNMVDGTVWTERWYHNDALLRHNQENWVNDDRNTKTIRIETDDGSPLPAGRYRLELYIENRLAATADFTIAGVREGAFPRVFNNLHFTTAGSPAEAAGNTAVNNFSNTVRDIYALFDWEQIAPSTLWRMRWSVDDVMFYEQIVPWNSPEVGFNFLSRLSGENGIPDGTYKLDLFINTVLLGTAEAQVGIGQLPIDRFSQSIGVQLNGRIVDAETREGLPGVTFILISEDFSVEEFEWNQEQVYAMATTDRYGNFQLDRLMEYGKPYSMIVQADGYLPVKRDGVEVDENDSNPLTVSIPLTRD